MKQTIFVSGSLAYDRIMNFPGFFGDHLMPEKLHALSVSFYIDKLTESFGGTAGNIAYNLTLLGEKPHVLGNVGNDFEKYRTRLHDMGIGTEALGTIETELTSGAYIITDKADNQITAFHPGAASVPGALPATASATSLVVVAPHPCELRTLPLSCKERGVPYFFDPGQGISSLSAEELQNGIVGASAFFCNDYEMELVNNITGWSEKDIATRVPIVVVTLGASGSRITSKEGTITICAVTPREVVDPTGAGDAYRAGFIKGYLLGLPLRTTGQLASTVASYAVEKKGTQEHSFTSAELIERYVDSYHESLDLTQEV